MATTIRVLRPSLAQAALALLVAAHCLYAGETARAGTSKKKQTSANPERRRVLSARPLAMYYYYDDARGLKSLSDHAAEIPVLVPQSFWVDADGFVHGGVPPQVLELARKAGIPIMPLLVNPGFDRPTARALLRNPKAQERAVTYLAYLAKRDNFVGWQLDLEYIDPADKVFYTKFVRRAAARLHRDGRLLSAAVVPRFSDRYPDTRAAEFRTGEWGAPYDYRGIGQAVDFLVVMTYDHHVGATPPGPVAGHAWMKEALAYAVRRVPRWKLLAGIPFYGREWVETAGGMLSRSLAFADIRPLLERPGIEVQWDPKWRAPWLQYREGPETHTIWFDDSRSYKEKLQLVRQYQVRGFAAWRLGTEDPQFWAVAAELHAPQPAAARRRRPKSRLPAASGSSASHSR